MKVAHVLPFSGLGGGPTYVRETSRELLARGIPVVALLPFTAAQRELKSALVDMGASVERLVVDRHGNMTQKTSTQLGDIAADVRVFLHESDLSRLVAAVDVVRRSSTTVVLHTVRERSATHLVRRAVTGWRRLAVGALCRRVVAVSQSALHSHAAALGARTLVGVAPGGVAPTTLKARPLRHRTCQLVTCGTIDVKVKGLDLVVRALTELPEVEAHFIGHGPSRDALSSLAVDLRVNDRIAFAGHVDDPLSTLAQGDIFVFPSRSEAWGLSLLEAMSLGLPAVVSDLDGPRELAGDAVAYFSSGDPQALVSAVRKLLDDKDAARALGARGRERARTWTWARTVDALLNMDVAMGRPTHGAPP